MSLAIGIDLGTTNSCAYIYYKENLHIIPLTSQESRTLPSFVFYDNDETIVGLEAERRAAHRPLNGIFDSKRIIGRKFTDSSIRKNKCKWPFTLKPGPNNDCLIEIQKSKNFQPILIKPELVSAEILKQIKKDAETYMKQEIKNAVITVPAHFSDAQRRATQKAAHLANLNVLELVNEPTAAAQAYTFQNDIEDGITLVYDLGGGTFDVSLMKFVDGSGTVIASKGDSNLGGRDFDNNLVNFILTKITGGFDNDEIVDANQRRILRRLKDISKNAKERLTVINSIELELDELFQEEQTVTITRTDFENINMDLFKRTIKIVDEILTETETPKYVITDIVLVGGSSRIPKIRELLVDYFNGKKFTQRVNPDEAVAMGAAICAARFNEKIKMSKINDIASHSYGISLLGGQMSVVIPKGSPLPTKVTKQGYSTAVDGQEKLNIKVFEGEDKMVKNNTQIGQIVITDIEPLPAGLVNINVDFEINANNILTVAAFESSNNLSKSIQCSLDYS